MEELQKKRNAFDMSACPDGLPKLMMKYIPALTEK
jgi:hypothetical protein